MERTPQRAEARAPEDGWFGRGLGMARGFFPGERSCKRPKSIAEAIPPTTPPRKRSATTDLVIEETVLYCAGDPQLP
jgi:hypothetical protein